MQENCHVRKDNSSSLQFEFGNRLDCGSGDPGSIPDEANLPRVCTPLARRLITSSDIQVLLSGKAHYANNP